MKPVEFYQEIQHIQKPDTIVSLSPGPFRIKADWHDAYAAKLLLWLTEQMPVNATVGDLYDILDAAKWWSTFWDSQSDSETSIAGIDNNLS